MAIINKTYKVKLTSMFVTEVSAYSSEDAVDMAIQRMKDALDDADLTNETLQCEVNNKPWKGLIGDEA